MTQPLPAELVGLPKVELHLHLDCSLSYDVVSRLDPDVSRAAYEAGFIAPRKCRDLADMLERAPAGYGMMQDEEALRLVTLDLFRQLDRDGVVYAEIRFAPLLHVERGLTPERVVEVVDGAVDEGIAATGIDARLILCTLRHFSEEQSLRTARLVRTYRGSRVVALDIAGDEAGYPIAPHVPAFRLAAEHGLHATAHAGEARGPDSVRETLRLLAPRRIGHGVRSGEDPELVRRLARDDIHLEVCPTSNVQIDLCEDYADHPIATLYEAGVPLGVNTDARTLCDTTLSAEYAHLQRAHDWGAAELLACNLAAVRASFADDETRQRVEARLRAGY